MKTIKLYGELGKRFGKLFKLDVSTPREAVRALSAQIAGFEKYMMTAHERGLGFAVFVDKENISEKEIDMKSNAEVIKIVPRVLGAKNGSFFQIVLGVVLVATGVFSFGATTAIGSAMMSAGIGMLVGGISQMLMPKTDTSNQNEDGNKANKGFGGAVTTVAQGNPVPVLRGKREIGGFIVSAGQNVVDVLVSNPQTTTTVGGSGLGTIGRLVNRVQIKAGVVNG